jgi:hypothetical protein
LERPTLEKAKAQRKLHFDDEVSKEMKATLPEKSGYNAFGGINDTHQKISSEL